MATRNISRWVFGLVAVAVLAFATSAEAGWRHRWGGSGGGSWGGGWGSSGGFGGWGSSGGWGSGGGWGSRGGWGFGWRHHRAAYTGWGSSGGWGGSFGGGWGSGGGYGGWGSSGGFGSSGGYGGAVYSSGYGDVYGGGTVLPGTVVPGTVIEGTPSTTTPSVPMNGGAAPPPPPADAPMPGGSTYLNRDSVLISVNVPAEAKVFVNGNPTTSTGTSRQYISRGLLAGRQYTYEFRAELNVDGEVVTDSQIVQLTAGQRTQVAFKLNEKATENVAAKKTKLTLNVPADAKVYLAGQETKSTGERREFVSTKVAGGGKWDNYTIRVVANIDGEEVEKEQTIKLAAGDDREVTFDFGTPELTLTAAR